jgi:hypothetical protein
MENVAEGGLKPLRFHLALRSPSPNPCLSRPALPRPSSREPSPHETPMISSPVRHTATNVKHSPQSLKPIWLVHVRYQQLRKSHASYFRNVATTNDESDIIFGRTSSPYMSFFEPATLLRPEALGSMRLVLTILRIATNDKPSCKNIWYAFLTVLL